MPAPTVALVDVLGVELADVLHEHATALGLRRGNKQVDVTAHEAIGVQPAFGPRQKPGEVEEIVLAIVLIEKALGLVIAALDRVNRNPGKHDARAPWHVGSTAAPRLPLTENVVCP